jgi:molybdopterin-guanine dinucleotide biosynthesis protein A
MKIEAQTTLAVLAGGEGSRMGVAKGMLQIGGRPILEYLLERWNWPGPTLLVTAPGREHPPGWNRFSSEVTDPVRGEGPLRGVLTALEAAETGTVVVATCDMPVVGCDQFAELIAYLQNAPQKLGAMWSRREGKRDQVEPFPGAFRKDATQVIRARLDAGLQSVGSLAEIDGFSVLPAEMRWGQDVWMNLNRPEDLKTLINHEATSQSRRGDKATKKNQNSV